ncbi:MAG TPA: hypothetical protein VLT90_13190 [Terriglobales bacterium]|nr:hypothetical protein [Terriglobales bacterium]
MTNVGLTFSTLLDGVVSDALSLGVFDKVNTHEPKAAPISRGVVCSIWIDSIQPTSQGSSLNNVTAVVVLKARCTSSMLSEPQDAIDTNITNAVDVFMGAIVGGFTLNGALRNVDIFGQHGQSLGADAGYINIDGKIFRGLTITIPCVVNDAWTEVA